MTVHDVAIVARDNRYGLTRDAEILSRRLTSIGVPVKLPSKRRWVLMDRLRRRTVAEVIIHLERIHPTWPAAAAHHVLIPNQERFPARHIGRLKHIDQVLAKTRHATEVFSELGVASACLGFTSLDRRDLSVSKDWNRFFHLAGGSTLKGTEDILTLWSTHPEWPELVLVQKRANAPESVPPNVTLLSGYLDDGELRHLQNACGVHLCPSRSEGWGHHIVEAMSCGAVVVTTDAPPMNEHVAHDCGVMVRAERSEPRHLGRNFFVNFHALETAVIRLLAETPSSARSLGARARKRFEEIDRSFTSRLRTLFVEKPGYTGTSHNDREGLDDA